MKVFDFFRKFFGLVKAEQATAKPVVARHPLDATTDEAAYRAALGDILAAETDKAVAALKGAFDQMPEQANHMSIMVHPSQDPDGFFSVMIHLDGPDLYVLNKALGPYRSLFAAAMTPTGPKPLLPMFDPFEAAFSVNDAIVDVAADWIEDVWNAASGENTLLPATIYGAEDYGPATPRKLPSAAA